MATFTLGQMIKHLTVVSAAIPAAEHEALDHASKLVLKECRAVVGHYQESAGPFNAWATLAPATLARKTADTPLLETGEMRDSYERTVGLHEAHVGSNNDKAVWQELGTRSIPPRSVIGISAMHMEIRIHHDTGFRMFGVLSAQTYGGVQAAIGKAP